MENVTEELVRQNGNQAAAVMADYAGQGGGGSIKLYKSMEQSACVYDFFMPKAGDIMFFGFLPQGYSADDPAWVYPFIIKEFDENSGTGTAMAFTAYATGRTHSVQGISEPVLNYLEIADPTNIPINPTGASGIVISPNSDETELSAFWQGYVA